MTVKRVGDLMSANRWMMICSTVCTRIAMQQARDSGVMWDIRGKVEGGDQKQTNWERVTQIAWAALARQAGNMLADHGKPIPRVSSLGFGVHTEDQWRMIARYLAPHVEGMQNLPGVPAFAEHTPDGWREQVAEALRASPVLQTQTQQQGAA